MMEGRPIFMLSITALKAVRSRRIAALAVAAVAATAIAAPIALANPGTGTSSVVLGHRATLSNDVMVNEDRIKFQTKDPTDIQMQTITFSPGATSGWHHHPGVILVIVETGQVTIFDEHCMVMETVTAGHSFVESGDDPMMVLNQGSTPAVVYNAQVAPAGSPFRVEDTPPACAG